LIRYGQRWSGDPLESFLNYFFKETHAVNASSSAVVIHKAEEPIPVFLAIKLILMRLVEFKGLEHSYGADDFATHRQVDAGAELRMASRCAYSCRVIHSPNQRNHFLFSLLSF
jgi:hypothetical protein